MLPLHSTDPQLGPAMALVALRSEFPHLPPVSWRLEENGHLSAHVESPAVFAAYVEALGGTPMSRIRYMVDGGPRESDYLFTTWRDVEISLTGVYLVEAAAVLKAVA